MCRGILPHIYSCLVKKTPFTPPEVDAFFNYFTSNKIPEGVLYAPYRTNELHNLDNNIYYQIATSDHPEKFWHVGCFDFSPPTDNRPFFNHFTRLGVKDILRHEVPMVPVEVSSVNVVPRHKVDRRVPPGDLPPLIVLLEAILLSTLFFGLPLFTKRELRDQVRGHKMVLGYFACLGLGFIFIEVCLIQRFVLFLGAPVYSIATVLGSILISVGLGSLTASRSPVSQKTIRLILWTTALGTLLLHFAIPIVTKLFLGYNFSIRLFVSIIVLRTAGFVMGMPFPMGIRFIKNAGKNLIPWA